MSFGPAGALFVALALSAPEPKAARPPIVTTLSLCVFCYMVGIAAGPAFIGAIPPQPAIGYAVAYPIAVMLTILACTYLMSAGKRKPTAEDQQHSEMSRKSNPAYIGPDQRVAVGYAVLVPVSMIAKVLLAQLIAVFF